ncbi:MAG: ATP-binding protein [Solirubrobacterales bacterium]
MVEDADGIRLSFRSRLILGFGALVVLTLAAVGAATLYGVPLLGTQGLVDEVVGNELNRLNVAADLKKATIETWLRERRANLLVLAGSASLQRIATGIGREETREILTETVRNYATGYDGLDAVMVLARDGTVLASAGDPVSLQASAARTALEQAFSPGNVESMAMVAGGGDEPLLIMCRQVFAPGIGTPIALVAATANPATVLTPLPGSRKWQGGSSEAYLITEDRLLLTPLRAHLQDGSTAQPMATRIETVAAHLAAEGNEGAQVLPDYRGIPALVAYRHLRLSPDLGWGMVLKTDQAEALAPLRQGMWHMALAGGIGLALFLAAAALLATAFTRPVRQLAAAAQRIRHGDFSARVGPQTLGEFQSLAKSFDGMAARIAEWHGELQRELDARTVDLRHERDRSRLYLDLAGVMLTVLRPDGSIAEINQEGARLLGADASRLGGADFFGFLAEDRREALRHDFEGVLAGPQGGIREWETQLTTEGGEHRTVVLHWVALRDGDGPAWGALASALDVTARQETQRQLAASEARYHTLVEALFEGVLLFDATPTVIACNEAALRIFDQSEPELIGRRLKDSPWRLVSDTGQPLTVDQLPAMTALQSRQPVRNVVIGIDRPSGRRTWTLVNAQPLFTPDDDQPQGVVASFVDITDQREGIDAQRRLTAELKRSNADLEQFSYAVSHDLQEPLRMVASFVQLLERRYAPIIDDDGREMIAFAVDGAQRMQKMITDLLEYSRVHRKGEPFAPLPVGEAVDAALFNLRAAIEESGARVSVGDMPTVTADRGQIIRLFQNILGNALKFRSPDRPPEVTVTAEPAEAGWNILVADNGIGIAPSDTGRLFGMFQRLHPRDRYPGSGVGLALCRRIVERHHGTITLHSPGEGQGTTIRFFLPDNPQEVPP